MKKVKKFSFQLIQNTYDVEETQNLLNELIDKKIASIEKQIESLNDRFVVSSPFLEDRLNHLLQAKDDLESFFRSVHSDEYDVMIDCPINIELSEMSDADERKKIDGIPLNELI